MIGSEMSDTPETLFAAGVELLRPHDGEVGSFIVRFRWLDLQDGMTREWRAATYAAVRRLAAQKWASLAHWVIAETVPYFAPSPGPQKPHETYHNRYAWETNGEAAERIRRGYANYPARLREWERVKSDLDGVPSVCLDGITPSVVRETAIAAWNDQLAVWRQADKRANRETRIRSRGPDTKSFGWGMAVM